MWRDTLRDIQWRRRRFFIAVTGTALVFAMTLLLAGVADSFHREVNHTVGGLGIDYWVVQRNSTSAFGSFMPSDTSGQVSQLEGVEKADPLVFFPYSVRSPEPIDVALIGHRPGGIGAPPISDGRAAIDRGEAVVDAATGLSLGSQFYLGDIRLTAVGVTSGHTILGGQPNVYVLLFDAQDVLFNNLPLATAVGVRGRPDGLPDTLEALSVTDLKDSLLRPLSNATGAINILLLLLWAVAGCIIGAVVYLSALERGRDFAVFKATGMSSWRMLGGLAAESTILSLTAAIVSAVLANLLRPLFPLDVSIPTGAYALLVVIAVLVGLAASSFGIRRASTIDPAMAFAGP